MTSVVVVLCTAPAEGSGGFSAERLARTVVEEGLCACVNVVPGVRSFFRWEGRVDAAGEQLLVLKTTAAAAPALRARLVELHPYQVPEVLELAVSDGLPGYLQWLTAAVTPPRG